MQPTDSKTPIASDATSQNSGIQTNEAQTNDTQKIAIPPSKKKSKPSSKTRRRLKDAEPIPFNIDGLSHDGRGL